MNSDIQYNQPAGASDGPGLTNYQHMIDLATIQEMISGMATAEQVAETRAAINQLSEQPNVTDAQIGATWSAYHAKYDTLALQTDVLLTEVKDALLLAGVTYPLKDWITLTQYTKRFDVKNVETIMNWIKRGHVPADHFVEVPQLGIKLIKAVPYQTRTYTKGA